MKPPVSTPDVCTHIVDLLRELNPGQIETLERDASLSDLGVLDSLRVVEFVLMLEKRFDIRVQPPDITPENFATVATIAAFVERQR